MPTATDDGGTNEPARTIVIPDPVIVRELATALHLKWYQVVERLMDFEVFATADSSIDFPTASALCSKYGVVARKGI